MSGVALITGGQQGIGLGVAKALKEAGFSIAIASLPERDAPAVQQAIKALGGDAAYFCHDVRDVAAAPALLEQVEAALGPVTTLVNNAGVGAPVRGDLLDLKPENWDFVQNVNLRGAFFLTQEVARRMLAQEGAAYRSISFVTSVSATMASPERGEYCVSKAGAAMMTQLFALRLAADNIGVFELRPGVIATEMTAGVKDKYDARIADGLVPAGRWGQPEDIGKMVVPLAQGQMAYCSGSVIRADGGLSIARL
ncbi:3-ketoacyl-ACP reductase [Shimia sp. R11_0]|uniref:3-ketoacyl-ACP reductase n=1 Tax=Shimia sp. R11_0 TaxID=2821096 RepID=UPI001ADA6B62|nr:3-ketoacyl-ACP reductase [Shimia sp. R11_0]MBO9478036.1 3-ketoacyl-ACP reductase [Shimia sp. R11_0]